VFLSSHPIPVLFPRILHLRKVAEELEQTTPVMPSRTVQSVKVGEEPRSQWMAV